MRSAAGLKALRTFYRIRRELEQRFRPPKTIYVWHRVPYYRQLWKEACEICGFTLVELKGDTWEVQQDGEPITRINNCYVELDNPVTLTTAGDKRVTYELLARAGLPVTPHEVFSPNDTAPMLAFMDRHPGPFVVKPSYGTGSGIGVTTHLTAKRACLKAATLASLHCPEIIIEQQVPGEVYRLLYLDDRIIAASRRNGLWVSGDGRHSIRELYLRKCPEDVTPSDWLKDPDFIHTAPLQGISHDHVPEEGQRVLVKSVAARTRTTTEVRTVYDEDALPSLSPAVIADAESAARILRSEFCGVDLITPDPSRPLAEAGGIIGEINTTPGLHHHHRLDGSQNGSHIGATVLRYLAERQAR